MMKHRRVKAPKVARRLKIRYRIRKTVHGTADVPRLSIYKSNTCIYAQLINDEQGHTLANAASSALGNRGIDVHKARKVGEVIAEKALEKGIHTIVFDRSGYLYHGRVRAVAEGAQRKGLKF